VHSKRLNKFLDKGFEDCKFKERSDSESNSAFSNNSNDSSNSK